MNQRLSRKTLRERQPGYRRLPPLPRPKELPRPNVFFIALVVTIGVFGLLSAYLLAQTLYEISSIAKKQDILRVLPDVRDAAMGQRAILDGRVAVTEPARYKQFVAYIRERNRGGGSKSFSWIEVVDQETPEFTVEVGSRSFRMESSYAFDRLIRDWTDNRGVDTEATTFSGAITIEGIAAGSQVMAIGRLVSADGAAPEFHAESIVGLSRAEYSDRLDKARVSNWWLAAFLALLAPILLYLFWLGARRVME